MKGGLCESCIDPGYCCRSMAVSGGSVGRGMDEPMSFDRAEHVAMFHGLPFRPLWQDEHGVWRWRCTALGGDGRCTIYERRPQLCRDFAAGSDPLCVHHVPASD